MSRRRTKRSKRANPSRTRARLLGALVAFLMIIWAWLGVWFVHQYPTPDCPSFISAPLLWIGNPVGDLTDALGLTGTDIVYEYDEQAPTGEVTFAGLPKRIGDPAPSDIQAVSRGEFIIGWSPSLRHPVWVAYHVPAEAKYPVGARPSFTKDTEVKGSPLASDYKHSGYDRGHMAPNYAIASRFGADMQKRTFRMSNIVPQSAALNRGVWRQLEHRIADLWTARYGEIWVIVGTISNPGAQTFEASQINIPQKFYQLVVAQEGYDVRAFAVVFDQKTSWDAWPTRHLVTIDELEEMTGLDFLAELPDFIQRPLESGRPSRLWPIRPLDAIQQILLRYSEISK